MPAVAQVMEGHMVSGRGAETSAWPRFMRWPRRRGAKERRVARLNPSMKRAMRSIVLIGWLVGWLVDWLVDWMVG